MTPAFHLSRTTQAVAHLLKLHHAKQVGKLRLVKLLYIAERESLAEYKLPITSDTPFAMKQGPILSTTHSLLRDVGNEGDLAYWTRFIGVDGTEVFLKEDPGHGKLCKAIRAKIEEVHKRFKDVEDEELIEATHQFAEWRKSWDIRGNKGSIEFSWEDALAAQGVSEEDIRRVREECALKEKLDHLATR